MIAFFSEKPYFPQRIILSRNLFMLTHAILPALLLGMLFAGLEWSGADVWLSAHFYDPIAQQWPYKEHWLIQKVFHKGGRLIFFAIVASILVMLQRSFKVDSALKAYRLSLMYLLLASISGPLIIMFLKNHTHIYCPWDLQLFGSFKPYIRWLDELSPALPVGHCFPAAHAGSGFAFVSLYFFFLATRARYKFYGLGFGLILGELYGFTQQMRGAHFLSHDIAALAVCWFMAVSLFMVFFRKQVQWQ